MAAICNEISNSPPSYSFMRSKISHVPSDEMVVTTINNQPISAESSYPEATSITSKTVVLKSGQQQQVENCITTAWTSEQSSIANCSSDQNNSHKTTDPIYKLQFENLCLPKTKQSKNLTDSEIQQKLIESQQTSKINSLLPNPEQIQNSEKWDNKLDPFFQPVFMYPNYCEKPKESDGRCKTVNGMKSGTWINETKDSIKTTSKVPVISEENSAQIVKTDSLNPFFQNQRYPFLMNTSADQQVPTCSEILESKEQQIRHERSKRASLPIPIKPRTIPRVSRVASVDCFQFKIVEHDKDSLTVENWSYERASVGSACLYNSAEELPENIEKINSLTPIQYALWKLNLPPNSSPLSEEFIEQASSLTKEVGLLEIAKVQSQKHEIKDAIKEKFQRSRQNKKSVRFADCYGLDLTRTFSYEKFESLNFDIQSGTDLKSPFNTNLTFNFTNPFIFNFGSPTKASSSIPIPTSSKSGHSKHQEIIFRRLFVDPINCPDFINRLNENNVVLESALTSSIGITGIVRVKNVSFEKQIICRYTQNGWCTSADVSASYVMNSSNMGTDKFHFTLPLDPAKFSPPIQIAIPCQSIQSLPKVQFCIQFKTPGKEFWDNNHGNNYVFTCSLQDTFNLSPPSSFF